MEKRDFQKIFKGLALLSQLGLTMVANIVVGYFLGNYLDNFFQLGSLFRILGLILGILAGLYSGYRLIMKTIGDD